MRDPSEVHILSRLERWRASQFVGLGLSLDTKDSEDELRLAQQLLDAHRKAIDAGNSEPPTLLQLVWRCKELIYDYLDGQPIFHAIAFSVNVGRGELAIGRLGTILTGDGQERVLNTIRTILAYARFADVPVVPNTVALAQELALHYRALMLEGFSGPFDKESRKWVRIMPARSPGNRLDNIDFMRQDLSVTEPPILAELVLQKAALEKELARLHAAHGLLRRLSVAVDRLEQLLQSETRNERALQRLLTEQPLLFGLEYTSVIPHHELGSEYEMDFALVRNSGAVDLVEIEASTHRLFNKRGDPMSCLTHAEQQVLDWLEWTELNSSYAKQSLPGIFRPRGIVVIGRTVEAERKKLQVRNSLFGGSLQILTYDDLLANAVNMRRLLTDL